MKRSLLFGLTSALLLPTSIAFAAPLYLDGVAPADGTLVFGNHLLVGEANGSEQRAPVARASATTAMH